MNTTTLTTSFPTLRLTDVKAWMFATIFVAGNLILPQLAHVIPNGGFIFLPIYFFTLVGAYLYGWQVGLLTAVASPLLNSALFGMPAPAVLPIIMIKGALLAIAASFAAHRYRMVSILILVAVVLAYQVVGCAIETAMTGSWMVGLQDFRLGIPGMLMQVIGGYFSIKMLKKHLG